MARKKKTTEEPKGETPLKALEEVWVCAKCNGIRDITAFLNKYECRGDVTYVFAVPHGAITWTFARVKPY